MLYARMMATYEAMAKSCQLALVSSPELVETDQPEAKAP